MESPYTYSLKEFGIRGDKKNIWGYHIYQDYAGNEPREFGPNSFESSYAFPLDGYFVLMKREWNLVGYVDKPIGVRNFNEVDEIERILYRKIKSLVKKFETKFNQGSFIFIRKVKNITNFSRKEGTL